MPGVTAKGRLVGAVVCVHAKGMKEPWCLAASDPDAMAAVLVNHYAKRWTIEPQFRDTKDLRFGMGLSATRMANPRGVTGCCWSARLPPRCSPYSVRSVRALEWTGC